MTQATAKMTKVAVTRANDRPSYWVGGDKYTFVASTQDTEGKFAIYESLVPPRHGAATHVHSRESESFLMEAGRLTVRIGEERIHLERGDFINFRPGLAYSFENEGDEPVKMLVFLVPAGLERFLAEVGTPGANDVKSLPPSSEDITRMIDGAKAYGIEYLSRPAAHD